jgi:hypothetical protein
VRVEIETALGANDLDVVPVLVNGARMPRAEELPPSLHPLLRRHAATIRRDPDFRDDVERLAMALRASVRTGLLDISKVGDGRAVAAQTPRRQKGRAALLAGAVFIGAAALIGLNYGWVRGLGVEHRAYACSGTLRYHGQNIDRATLRLDSRQWPRALWPAGWRASQGRWDGNGSLELPSGFHISFYDNEAYRSGNVLLFSERYKQSSRRSVGSFHPGGLLRFANSELHCVITADEAL